MDLQVCAIILIVFLVSFLSYLFISKFLPHGKTFDEMIAEKKRMREEVLGAVRTFSSGKQNSAASKKKLKKEAKKKETQSKAPKEVTSNESDASESSEAFRLEPVLLPETLILKKNATKAQQQKKGKGKGGILLNKNEPILLKESPMEEEVNHFELIHPKDDVEIHRNIVKENDEKKHFRDIKKLRAANVDTPQISPKNQPAKETKAVEEMPAKKKRNESSTSAMDSGIVQLVSDEIGIIPLIRELSRADLTKNQIQVLIDFLLNKQSDTLAHDPSEWSEGKSDLVHKLKKQLQEKEAQLKNEQDALSGMQSKLKELRNEFNFEKVQYNANLKAHADQLNNSKMEIKNLQTEIQFLNNKHSSEKQSMSASFNQIQAQCAQMKESLKVQDGMPNILQLQAEHKALQQDVVIKNQQIVELNSFVEDGRQNHEQFKQMLAERDSKIAEFDVHLRKKDERFAIMENELRQRVQELTNRDGEIQKLNIEVARSKESDKVVQRQTFELEQLKKQLSDHLQNNHAVEENKIEIRNLQNALDSSKKELEAQRVLLNDYRVKLEDLNQQLTESKQLTNSKSSGDNFLLHEKLNELTDNHQNILSQKEKQLADYQKQVEILQNAENDLTKQIDEQKTKNNDLRTKNWKLVEALQSAQSSTTKSAICSNFVIHPSVEATKVKYLLAKHFPETTSSMPDDRDDSKWLESVFENLKIQLVSNKSSRTSTNTSSIANNNNETNNNHLNNCSDVETNNLNNSSVNGDSNSSASSTAESELVLFQNAQLKTTVEEYKNIIAETESMLKNLESKVREQDAYWTKVVLLKDNEIENLKNVSENS